MKWALGPSVLYPLHLLFSLVYTWIKYKMTPPSLLALNRLFVERNSKHRRITSNLGLTFRNSKWSSYARSNINLNSKSNYLTLAYKLGLALFAFVTFTAGLHLYNQNASNHFLISLYWFTTDVNLYSQITLSSGFLYLVQSATTLAHGALLNVFLPQPTGTSVQATPTAQMLIPRRLHKPILCALVAKSTNADALASIFNENSVSTLNPSELKFMQSLYATAHLARTMSMSHLLSDPASTSFLCPSSARLTNASLVNDVSSLNVPSLNTIALDYMMFNQSKTTPLRAPLRSTRWTLGETLRQGNQSPQPNRLLQGLFYLPNLTYTQLNDTVSRYPELQYLRESINTQTHAIRWNRWLYKYSTLHRSSLKASLHLTTVKKALGSGFYDQNLGTRNLWVPTTLTTHSTAATATQLNLLHTSLYGNYLKDEVSKNLTPSGSFYNKSQLSALNFYEPSYHWALQRFFHLNSLTANTLRTQPLLASTLGTINFSENVYGGTLTAFSLSLNNATRANAASSSLRQSTALVASSLSVSERTSSLLPSYDTHLAYSTNLFFTKERLEFLQNLSKNTTSRTALVNNQTDCNELTTSILAQLTSNATRK